MHPQVKEKAGRKPFKEIKIMKDDAAGVEKMGDEIKAHYSQALQSVTPRSPQSETSEAP